MKSGQPVHELLNRQPSILTPYTQDLTRGDVINRRHLTSFTGEVAVAQGAMFTVFRSATPARSSQSRIEASPARPRREPSKVRGAVLASGLIQVEGASYSMPKEPSPAPDTGESRRPILSLRSAVLVLLAVITGFGAGYLTFAAHHQITEALLTGFAAAGGSLWWYDRFIS